MATYKIAGKIQRVKYEQPSANNKYSISIAPDSDYSLTNNNKKYVVLLPIDSCMTIIGEYDKDIEIVLTQDIPNFLVIGRHMELELIDNDGGNIEIAFKVLSSNLSKKFNLKTFSILA